MDSFASIPPNLPPPNTCEEDVEMNDDATASDTDNQSLDNKQPSMDPKLRLSLAQQLKSEGNDRFKQEDYDGAIFYYKDAVKKLGDDPSDDELKSDFRDNEIAIQLNLALCYMKQKNWVDVKQVANSVLKLNKNNIKALYRRGYANSQLGFYEEAKEDLMAVYNSDNNNVDAHRELLNVKKRLTESKAKEKLGFQNLFSRAEGLYDDREKQIQEQKQREEMDRKKEYAEFEAVNKERELKSEVPFSTIEEWKKSKEKQEEPRQKSYSSKSKETQATSLEYDEEDEKILQETKKMGYRYFDRPNQEKSTAKPVPKRIEEQEIPETTVDQSKTLSAWNAAGTYEEKDCTQWFKDELENSLKEISVETDHVAFEVVGLREFDGEAQIMIVRATKRYLYSFDFVVDWRLTKDDTKVDGSIEFSDVSSTATSKASNPVVNGIVVPDWFVDCKLKYSTKDLSIEKDLTSALKTFKELMFDRIKNLEKLFESQ